MKLKTLFILTLSIFFLTGCNLLNSDSQELETNQPPTEAADPSTLTLDSVSEHSSQDDCWMVINNKVYDVTKFVNSHPGGKVILDGCGKDATTLFNTRPMGSKTPHSSKANKLLEKYFIGDLNE